MKENWKKLKIINILSVADNIKNCCTYIRGCCSSAAPMSKSPLRNTEY